MGSTNPSAVELVIRDWLVELGPIFQPIIEEVADSLAPLVAEQALSQLKDRLAGMLTRDELLDQVELVMRDAVRFIESEQSLLSPESLDASFQVRSSLRETINRIHAYRGCKKKAFRGVSFELAGADRGGEGGAE